jgi:hypothetical protein
MVSASARKVDSKLYVLADKRSLGPPPLPLPRAMVAMRAMLCLARASSCSALVPTPTINRRECGYLTTLHRHLGNSRTDGLI